MTPQWSRTLLWSPGGSQQEVALQSAGWDINVATAVQCGMASAVGALAGPDCAAAGTTHAALFLGVSRGRWVQRTLSCCGALTFPRLGLLLPLPGADYGQISEETWIYLSTLYGGGPEIAIRQNVAQVQELENLHGEQKIEAETRAV